MPIDVAATLRARGKWPFDAAEPPTSPTDLQPPPEHADKLLHWVRDERTLCRGLDVTPTPHGPPEVWRWSCGRWLPPEGGSMSPAGAYHNGYRYLGPAEWREPGPFDAKKLTDPVTIGEWKVMLDAAHARVAELEAEVATHAWAPSKINLLQHHVTTLEATNAELRARIVALEGRPVQSAAECRDAALLAAIGR